MIQLSDILDFAKIRIIEVVFAKDCHESMQTEIVKELGLNHITAVKKLNDLVENDILQKKMYGRFILYRLREEKLICRLICELIQEVQSI